MIKTILLVYPVILILILIYSFFKQSSITPITPITTFVNNNGGLYMASPFFRADEDNYDEAENNFNKEIEEIEKPIKTTTQQLNICNTNKKKLNDGIERLRSQIKNNAIASVNAVKKDLETCDSLQVARYTKYKNAYRRLNNKEITDGQISNLLINNKL